VRQVRKRAARPEEQWTSATIEQVADLRVWVAARMREEFAQDLCEWLFTLGDPAATEELSKRRLALYRKLLDSYGPPRDAAAKVNVDTTSTVVRLRLAEMSESDDDGDDDDDDPEAEASASGSRRFHRA
jgi:hypothetical protein